MSIRSSSPAFEGVVLLGLVVFIVVTAIVVLAHIRRRMRSSMPQVGRPEFELAELRQLRDGGWISKDEYESPVQFLVADCE